MLISGIMPPKRHEAGMHGVDGTAGGRGGDHREQGRGDDAEADLLAFHVPARAVDAEGGERGIGMGLRPVGHRDAGQEQHTHGGQDRPALALVAGHAAEDIGEAGADHEDRDDLHEVAERGRVLVGVRGIGVEEAAAVGAQHLDRELRGDWSLRDRLLTALDGRGSDVGVEVLRHALPDVEHGSAECRAAGAGRACSGRDRPRSCRSSRRWRA